MCIVVTSLMIAVVVLLLCMCVFVVIAGAGALFLYTKKKGTSSSSTSSDTTGDNTGDKTGNAGELGTAAVGSSGKTNITFYGQNAADDNGVGVVGVDLFAHGKAGIKFQGKSVYPVAVHQNHAASMLYKVIEVKGNGVKPILGHVVDMCNKNDASCSNYKKNNLSFLVDIHKTGFAAAGRSDGVTTGDYKVIGHIPWSSLPKSVWTSKVQAGSNYMLCSCTNDCAGNNQKWSQLGKCTA